MNDDITPNNLDQLVAHIQRNLNALAAEVVALKIEVAQLKATSVQANIVQGSLGDTQTPLGAMRLG